MATRPPTSLFVVKDLQEAVGVAADHGDAVVLDVDNTLVAYGASKDERRDAMIEAVDAVAAHGLRRLAFITNGRGALPQVRHESLIIHALDAARKPYVRLPPLRHVRDMLAGAAVYGDQPLTDGMLARNLGGIWIQPRHAHVPDEAEPWWPRVMRQAGRRKMDRHFTVVSRR